MCMYIDVFPFFSNEKLAKSTTMLSTGVYCVCLGRFEKSVILDISFYFVFFFMVLLLERIFQMDRLLFLFDAAV